MLRIDNGDLEFMCIMVYVFYDTLALTQSIWMYYIK